MKYKITEDIDFHKYYTALEVKDFDVFIGPNGEYYKVRNILDEKDLRTHYIWAQVFFMKKNLYKKMENMKVDPLKTLIDEYGYIRYSAVRYSRNPIIDVPKYVVKGFEITHKQIESVYNLLKVKEEYLNVEQINELEKQKENMFYDMEDNYFRKRLEKVIVKR